MLEFCLHREFMLFKNTKTHYLGFVCLFLFASVKLLIIAVKNNVLLSSSYNQILHYLTFIFSRNLIFEK